VYDVQFHASSSSTRPQQYTSLSDMRLTVFVTNYFDLRPFNLWVNACRATAIEYVYQDWCG